MRKNGLWSFLALHPLEKKQTRGWLDRCVIFTMDLLLCRSACVITDCFSDLAFIFPLTISPSFSPVNIAGQEHGHDNSNNIVFLFTVICY